MNQFTNYIHYFEDVWVSNRLIDQDILRCLNKDSDKWVDCPSKYNNIVEKHLETRKGSLETNPWGYYGKHNPETGVFLGEDYAFCKRWTDLGGKIYANVDAYITHYGTHGFRGRFIDEGRKVK